MGPCTTVIGRAFRRISESQSVRANVIDNTGTTCKDPPFSQIARRDQGLAPTIAVILDSEKATTVIYCVAYAVWWKICICAAIDVAEPIAGFKRQTADPFVLDL